MSTILELHRALIAVECASSGNRHVVAWVEVVAPGPPTVLLGPHFKGKRSRSIWEAR